MLGLMGHPAEAENSALGIEIPNIDRSGKKKLVRGTPVSIWKTAIMETQV